MRPRAVLLPVANFQTTNKRGNTSKGLRHHFHIKRIQGLRSSNPLSWWPAERWAKRLNLMNLTSTRRLLIPRLVLLELNSEDVRKLRQPNKHPGVKSAERIDFLILLTHSVYRWQCLLNSESYIIWLHFIYRALLAFMHNKWAIVWWQTQGKILICVLWLRISGETILYSIHSHSCL